MSQSASASFPSHRALAGSRTGTKLFRALVGGALLTVAAGCVPNQQKEVAQYRKVIDGDKPLVLPKVQPGQPLSLEEALLLANRHDENLAENGESYLQALIDKDRAFSAFIPTLSLAPTYTWVDKPGAGASSVVGGTGTTIVSENGGKHTLLDVPVTGSVNVFNGFQNVADVNRAGFSIEQRRALLLDLQMTLFLEVAQAYYNVLIAERSVVVLTNSAAVQDASVADMKSKLQAGVARPLDVAQAEAQAAATRAQLVTARSNVRNSRTMLAYMVDEPVQNAPLIDRVRVPDQLEPSSDYVGRGQVGRQDLVAARAGAEASRQIVKQALGAYWPSVTVNVDYFLHKESFPTLSEWDGLLSVSVPIFSAGTIEANVRTAWSQLRQAELQSRYVSRTINQQVLTAYENVYASAKRLVELRTEVKAAQDALRLAQQTYQAGLATYLDQLTAQQQLLTAQLSLVTEELNYKVYYLNLLRVVGQLARPEQIPADTAPPASQPSDLETMTPVPNLSQMARPPAPPEVSPPATEPTQPAISTQPEPNPTTSPATQPATQPTTQPTTGLAPAPSAPAQ